MLHRMCLATVVILTLSSALNAQDECKRWSWCDMFDLDPRTGFFGYHAWDTPKEPDPPCVRLYRAGCPHCYAPWARCQDDRHYVGYYVGGGAVRCGEPRYYDCEGTWGWDYKLRWTRVRLDWYHGARHQGGEGQYNPDRKNDPLADLSD